LPTHGRLYTIIGPLKRGTIHICLRRRRLRIPDDRREADIQLPGGHAGMNAPIPRILIESMWRGRLFGAQWRPAIGGSLDVLEPATGAVITRVGNATAEDVRQAAAEARAAQPGWAATPYDQRAAILRKVAALMEENQSELVYWIMRETGGSRPRLPSRCRWWQHPAPARRRCVPSPRDWCCRATAAGYRWPGACRAA
jgi:hypothetical protein